MISGKPIAVWVREVMLDTNYGNIQAIILCHDSGIGSGKEVDNIVFGGDKQWDPKELEQRFLGKIENFCGANTGRHAFILNAIYDTSAAPRNTLNFHYDVADQEYSINHNSPTKEGIIQQLMRHTEITFKQSSDAISSMMSQMVRMTEMATQRAHDAETENREAWIIVREMGNALMDKRQEHKLEQLRYQRSSELMSRMMKLAPGLINQALGMEVFPQGIADNNSFEAFAESLDIDTIEILSQRMPPEVWGVISNRITEVLLKKKSESARDQKILAETKNPEDNAAGETSITTSKPEFIQ
jgi:hypothetical protein